MEHGPFTDEELAAASTVPLTDEILLHAMQTGTQALSEFGHIVIDPIIKSLINPTDRETAFGLTFYRLLGAVRTLSDLRRPYHFQAVVGQTRLIFELCADIALLQVVSDSVEKFHGFTQAARFSAAFKTVEFYKEHPELEEPGDAEERRALVETPRKKEEIEMLCQSLWGRHKAPPHWSGLGWEQQMELLGADWERQYVQSSQMRAWLVHGGGAAVGGLSPKSFRAMEIISRESVKHLVPEAYRLVAVELHMHRAFPSFFEELDRVKNKVELYAATDARLQTLGRPSKLLANRTDSKKE